MRRTFLITTAALATLIASACGTTTITTGPAPAGGAVPSAVPTTTIEPSAAPSAAIIPSAALLQPADLRGPTPEAAEDGYWDHLTLPDPCGTGLDSDAKRLDDVTKRVMYPLPGSPPRPTVIVQYVARYQAGGAGAALDEIKAAVGRCPEAAGERELRWKVEKAADDTLVLTAVGDMAIADLKFDHTTAVGLVAVGDALVLVADAGWENRSGQLKVVRELLPKAVDRAKALT